MSENGARSKRNAIRVVKRRRSWMRRMPPVQLQLSCPSQPPRRRPGPDAAAAAPDNAGQVAQPSEQAAAHVPLPRPRPDKLAAATTAVADVTLDLKPGSVIKGANGL